MNIWLQFYTNEPPEDGFLKESKHKVWDKHKRNNEIQIKNFNTILTLTFNLLFQTVH